MDYFVELVKRVFEFGICFIWFILFDIFFDILCVKVLVYYLVSSIWNEIEMVILDYIYDCCFYGKDL